MAYKPATISTEGLVGFREFIQGQCTPISGKSYKFLVATFTFTAAYDTMILTFMVARAFSTSRWRVDSYLFKTIYGDGVAFYIYIFGVSLVNIIFIFTTLSTEQLLPPVAGLIPFNISLPSGSTHTETSQ
ncbi:hypothetical protein AGABI1DRAFT_132609 [Agaricus bisporus var. burnettii JB137-S8]|uniref:Uncharacterized protein n=1 Tax=Agaricus bisporus var. burnettii (strain JB137-S8 / ATCC MYA-4627 / FGSC 10392) TaxID=597362 RepID=K5WWZ8_AGABU|nr:uncharacterized protein AGABI1DRAFT_132609 [Agaricus bisporus var. burnettii JB137-S8]EKM75072.1 hypothetical protein AGABI1DRAFT_132609 [Agaricus bisporus var. burnettii JB137-S8]